MSNMHYCRFQNTLSDLRECADAWNEEDLSREELLARAEMFEVALNLLDEMGVSYDAEDVRRARRELTEFI